MDKTIKFEEAKKFEGPVSFSAMVKPGGSLCNLNCTYCYYLDKVRQYGGKEPVMNDELLEVFIKQYIAANDADVVQFVWHGGEPLLLSLDFFRKAMKLQKKYANGKKIENSLQTNGTLLNDDWCRFFVANKFLIGISLDGPEDIHDSYRLDKSGQPTFEKVMKGLSLLKRYNVDFNTMSVVTKKCEGRGAEIYEFFKSIGSHYMQFMPAVDHYVSLPGYQRPLIVAPDYPNAVLADWSVSSEGYGHFLNDVFDKWVVSDVGQYFVQMFDATLAQYCNVTPGVCTMCETCGEDLTVEHNGDVYCCDHSVYPGFKLGNIVSQDIKSIFNKPERLAFGLNKRETLPVVCKRCIYYKVCRGGCPQHRFFEPVPGEGRVNYLCAGLKLYFEHTKPCMEYMKNLLMMQHSPAEVMPFARKKQI